MRHRHFGLVLMVLLVGPFVRTAMPQERPSSANGVAQDQNAKSNTEVQQLTKDIHALAARTRPENSYTASIDLMPAAGGLMVTVKVFLSGELKGTERFRMPCSECTFKLSGGILEVRPQKDKTGPNVGPYEPSIAAALQQKLTRLNALLTTKAKP